MNRVTRNDPQDAWMAEILRSRAEDQGPRSDCPHPERIWDAVRLQLPLDERLAIIDHISECPTCAEAWSLAATLEPTDEHRPQPHVNSLRLNVKSGTSVRLVGAAAMLLIALGIGFIAFRQGTRPTDVVAEVSQPQATTTPGLPAGNQQSAALPNTDFTLRWTPGPAGSRYDVTVMTADKRVVAEAQNLEVTEYQLPSKMRIELAAVAKRVGVTDDALLFWRVVARTPEGSMVSSDLLPVALRGTAPPAALADEGDEAAIRKLITAYESFLKSRDLRRLRSTMPNATPAQFGALERDLPPGEVQDVAIEVLDLRLQGRTAEARTRRRETVQINGERRMRIYAQTLRFEEIDPAGNWRLTADPPMAAIDK